MPKSNITDNSKRAVHWLKSGKILAYPSESVWGLGVDGYCQSAVMALLTLKQRDIHKGLIVLIDDGKRILPLIRHLPQTTQQQIIHKLGSNNHTTQAQTWLVPVIDVPDWLTGGQPHLAVRVSPHTLLRTLCQALISPDNPYGFLVSTSCNPSNLPPAKNLSQAYDYFGKHITYLNADTLGFNKPSCIRDVLTGQVLRD